MAPESRKSASEDVETRLKLGAEVRLLTDLPPGLGLVQAGTIGVVKNVTGPEGIEGRYRVQFKLPGEYTTTITIENVRREQLSIVQDDV